MREGLDDRFRFERNGRLRRRRHRRRHHSGRHGNKPAIQAAEDFVNVGYPCEAEAMLLVELDGPPVEVDYLVGRVEAIALRRGATQCRISNSEAERHHV
jgi:hypothetical protein